METWTLLWSHPFLLLFILSCSPNVGIASQLASESSMEVKTSEDLRNFNGHVIRVAVEEWIPHVAVQESPPGNIAISGPMAKLLHNLAVALNFKYILVRPPDGSWGIPVGNGDWNGMIGMVKRNEADIALGPFGLTYSRSRVVDFSFPILIDYYRILVKRDKPEVNPWSFMQPFSWGVWVLLVFSFFVTSLVIWLTVKFSPFNTDLADSQKSMFKQFWLAFSELTVEALTPLGRGFSYKLILTFWLIVTLILTKTYSSALTSLLAVRIVPIKYDYLVDVISDPDMHLIFEKDTALVEYMSVVQSGIYRALADTKLQNRSHFEASSDLYDVTYKNVRNKKYALMVEDTTCRKVFSDDFTKYGRCDFYIGKEEYWPLIFCLIANKGHPILKHINTRLQRIISMDLYFKWISDEVPNATACLKAPTAFTMNTAYGIEGLGGIFVVAICGLVFSLMAFFLELIVYNFMQK